MSHLKHEEKHSKREDRAEETPEPPLGNGDPDPPLAEPELPTEKVVVYGDASATYGSMVAPEVIRPHAGKIEGIVDPLRKEQEKDRTHRAEKEEKRRKAHK